jgi:ABC-2 type transport system permease protein
MTDGRRMTRWDAFGALCLARWRETYRQSEIIIWSVIFPVLLAVGLGIAFRNRPAEVVSVAIVAGPGAARVTAPLATAPGIHAREMSEAEAAQALRLGKVTLVAVPTAGGLVYRLDPTRPDSLLARSRVDDALQRAAGRQDALATREEKVAEPGSRYIDFLIPGILGMNLMAGGMWGIGYHLVDMRIKKLLRRYLATPLRRVDFMLAQMTVRVAFVFLEVAFLLGFARLAFGLPVRGSLATILLVAALGALSFAGIGLAVASRAATIEKVAGLMNVIQMPMFICSGVFFSADRFPDALQPLIRALPLTALVDTFRAVILEGAGLLSQGRELAIVAAWGVLCFALGIARFRWD